MRYLVVGIATVTLCGCASPTAPTHGSGGTILQAPRTLAVGAPADAAACTPYTWRANGLCHAIVALDCDSATGARGQTCDALIAQFQSVTGHAPPWLNRIYISRDPLECVNIRWLCAEGYDEFSDETGCGCEPVSP